MGYTPPSPGPDDETGQGIGARAPRFSHVANKLFVANSACSRSARLFLVVGVLLAAAATVGTALTLSHLRERALVDRETALRNVASIVAEQTAHTFQDIGSIAADLIDRMQALGVTSNEQYQREMAAFAVLNGASGRRPGLFLTGNYFAGISVAACVAHASHTATCVDAFLQGRAQSSKARNGKSCAA